MINTATPIESSENFVIRVHLSDGTIQSFSPIEQAESAPCWQQVDPGRIFTQPRIVVAGERSKSVFVTAHVVRVDFMHRDFSTWVFPGGYADVAELTEEEFRRHAHLDQVEKMRRRDDCTPVGDLLVSFIELHMFGGARYRMMTEFPVKLPADNQGRMRFLLSKGAFQMRLACGGFGVVNMANLVSYTVYPGVSEIPADSWMAEPINVLTEETQ
jgi:hypothetical protein